MQTQTESKSCGWRRRDLHQNGSTIPLEEHPPPQGLRGGILSPHTFLSYLFIQVVTMGEENYRLIKKCSQRSKPALMRMTVWHYADLKALNDTISRAPLLLSHHIIVLWNSVRTQVLPEHAALESATSGKNFRSFWTDRGRKSQGKGRRSERKGKRVHKRKQMQHVRGRKSGYIALLGGGKFFLPNTENKEVSLLLELRKWWRGEVVELDPDETANIQADLRHSGLYMMKTPVNSYFWWILQMLTPPNKYLLSLLFLSVCITPK